MATITNEASIRAIVRTAVETYAETFSLRHISEIDNPDGVINMKINNVFIAALGSDIQYYSALMRSLDSSLGNMLEKMAINIARLHYEVTQSVEGDLYREQTNFIAHILEQYKSNTRKPLISDYRGAITQCEPTAAHHKVHVSDYYLHDVEDDMHYLIELKIGGDLDNKKARSEKEALLEQYCILANEIGEEKIKIYFATAYNRYGEGNEWKQSRVLQFFAKDELLISSDFWNMVCKSLQGYEIVLDEYKKNAHYIIGALKQIKDAYLSE